MLLIDSIKKRDRAEILRLIAPNSDYLAFNSLEEERTCRNDNILHVAAIRDIEIFKFLIELLDSSIVKNLLLKKNNRSYTPLGCLFENGRNSDEQIVSILETLIKIYGEEPFELMCKEEEDWSPMILAIKNNMSQTVKFLSFRIQILPKYLKTALELYYCSSLSIIENLMTENTLNDSSVVENIIKIGNLKIFEIMIKIKPDVLNFKSMANENILHLAAKIRNEKIIEHLLEPNSLDSYPNVNLDINQQAKYGTPLHYAVNFNHSDRSSEIVRLLLDHGADPNRSYVYEENYCKSPLHHACKIKNVEIAKLLLEYGAEITPSFYKKFGAKRAKKILEEVEQLAIPDVKGAL